MNLKNLLAILFFAVVFAANAEDLKLKSPNQDIKINVRVKDKIYYSVSFKNERVLEASPLTLSLETATLGANGKLLGNKQTSIDGYSWSLEVNVKQIFF